MGAIRPFLEDDVTQVADLNWQVLRGGTGSSPRQLRAYFRELFFHNPWFSNAMPSLVYEEEKGRIVGFLGVMPRRMFVRGKPTQVACGSNLVVHPDSRSRLAGVGLMRSFLSGKQDLSICDAANDLSRRIWEGLGGTTALLYSLHWSRPLRPSLYGLYVLARLKKGRTANLLALGGKPFAHALDALVTRRTPAPVQKSSGTILAEDVSVETLLACISEFSAGHVLTPQYDLPSLRWLLDFMGRMKAYGELRKVALRNQTRKLIGWYLYYLERGRVGEVVQIGARSETIDAVLDHLFDDAWRQGAIALHGRVEPRFLRELGEKKCFFFRRGGWMLVHSRTEELLQPIHRGDSFLSRLDGEWCVAFRQ